ncbi:hypothetical protein BGZ49_000329 [Haplosporangium sp. Z 27]|nr:hypothetical protein BGZ49_000329 [Haplosporangium sp. Z 27]
MHFKKSTLAILALVLAVSSVSAQGLLDNLLPAAQNSPSPAASARNNGIIDPFGASPSPPGTTDHPTQNPTSTAATSDAATTAPIVTTASIIVTSNTPTLTIFPTTTAAASTTDTRPKTSSFFTTSTLATSNTTASATSSAPLPSNTSNSSSPSANKLAAAGIVVGSVVVAAAVGIWVFRKWKLSPSRGFQDKIRGEEYQDYPRSYEADTVYLRNMDTPVEPAATKASPYSAAGSLPPPEEPYYDPNYANEGYAHHHDAGYGYDQGYDQGAGYDHHQGHQGYGYDNGYGGHNDYAESQVGAGGYAPSQVGGGYAPSNVGGGYAPSNVGGGYAPSNVGGGYPHQGYDEYGRR